MYDFDGNTANGELIIRQGDIIAVSRKVKFVFVDFFSSFLIKIGLLKFEHYEISNVVVELPKKLLSHNNARVNSLVFNSFIPNAPFFYP